MTKPILCDQNLNAVDKIKKLYQMRIHMATDEFHYEKGCMLTNLTGEVANSNEHLRKLVGEAWIRLITMSNGAEKDELREAMLEYCKLDTYAMVRIFEEMERV